MELITLVALVLGYLFGLLQGGIKITHEKPEEEDKTVEYNQSVGNQEYMDYFDKQRSVILNGNEEEQK